MTKYKILLYNQLKKETAIHLQRSFGIWPETVRENVLRKLYARKYFDEESTDFNVAESEFGDEADKLRDMVSLTDQADHYAAVLSGGEKQRIGIARIMLACPDIIVMDEPTSALDVFHEKELLHTLKTEYSHSTWLIISHRMSTLTCCNRLYKLENGQLIQIN